jgi:hypothetical protein
MANSSAARRQERRRQAAEEDNERELKISPYLFFTELLLAFLWVKLMSKRFGEYTIMWMITTSFIVSRWGNRIHTTLRQWVTTVFRAPSTRPVAI